jgi:hypothetical protein
MQEDKKNQITSNREYTDYVIVNWLIPRLEEKGESELLSWYKAKYIDKVKVGNIPQEKTKEDILQDNLNRLVKNYNKENK